MGLRSADSRAATDTCATCSFWVLSRTELDPGWKIGLGKCTNVPKFFDATEELVNSDDSSGVQYNCQTLKPGYQNVKALALDGDGFVAELLTMPDFGCVSYVQK
jgi:hypothetical protein